MFYQLSLVQVKYNEKMIIDIEINMNQSSLFLLFIGYEPTAFALVLPGSEILPLTLDLSLMYL